MNDTEKATRVAQLLLPETVQASELLPYIELSKEIVLSKRYPFGNRPDNVPTKFENIQCQIALELWNKKGAEGELSHSENGISRQWESLVSHTLLNLITPCCESVVENESA